jgi:putative SOS response-associated peptidase YedK
LTPSVLLDRSAVAEGSGIAGEDRPLLFFAGNWTNRTSTRKIKEGEVNADVFGFLTTEANGVVGPVHPKAMPVILTSEDEIETWMLAPPHEALWLQRPLPDDVLQIVARGERSDDIAA